MHLRKVVSVQLRKKVSLAFGQIQTRLLRDDPAVIIDVCPIFHSVDDTQTPTVNKSFKRFDEW